MERFLTGQRVLVRVTDIGVHLLGGGEAGEVARVRTDGGACVVDHGGLVDRRRMRCDPRRHPLLAHEGSVGTPSPTRLHGGALLPGHDDHDCAADMCRVWPGLPALLVPVGTGVHPRYGLTDEGRRVAAELRAHRGAGGKFSDFVPATPAARGADSLAV